MSFAERVYEILKQVPEGKVTTYKVLAEKLDNKAYQAIGQALKNNPDAPEIPCHRVVKTDGSIGGYGGETEGPKLWKKIKLLSEEGVVVKEGEVQDFEEVLWD